MNSHVKPSSPAIPRPLGELNSTSRVAAKNLPAIVKQLLPGGTFRGREYIVRNPKRDDKRAGSFKICVSGPKAGVWSDFAANATGRDLISLVAYVKSLSRPDAAVWVEANVVPKIPNAASLESQVATPAAQSEAVTLQPPEGAESPAHALARMGRREPDLKWTYRSDDGAIRIVSRGVV